MFVPSVAFVGLDSVTITVSLFSSKRSFIMLAMVIFTFSSPAVTVSVPSAKV